MSTNDIMTLDGAREFLKTFYGDTLQKTQDLAYTACCVDEGRARFREILDLIPEEVKSRQYGCGSPIPADSLAGLTVLDLGSGAGTDSFILSKLVGEKGQVVGIDMTEGQLDVARRNAPFVARNFGYERPNTEFRKEFIETAASLADGSVDLVISNCVINLSPLKAQVFRTLWRVLRPGGEFTISDIVCDRRLPASIRQDPQLYGECLAGSEYYPDLKDLMEAAGFRDVRELSRRALPDRVGADKATFLSVTLRGFKLQDLDRRCEDYGQTAEYLGTCPGQAVEYPLDGAHAFEAGRPIPVCRNTALMLSETRLSKYFRVSAPRKHFGLFRCGPTPAAGMSETTEECCA